LEDLLALGEDVSEELLDAIGEEVAPSDDAMIIYTSGTTAHPKGILHSQRAPVIQSWRFAEDMQLTPEDVVFTAQPFFWTAGIAMSLGASLAAGARLLTLEIFEAERALEVIEGEKVTTLHAWPHQEKALAEHPSAAQRDLGSLCKVEFSSPMAALAGLEQDAWGTYGSYGMSETFTLASSLPAWTPADLRAKTSGKPLPGMQLRIVDVESGWPLAPGESGEIAVKGATFMRGYYKVDPEHYLDEEGFFRTQDGGFIDPDGYLHWKGRLSNLIKTGGANVSPLEIENTLGSRSDIRLALAVGVPHPALGEVIVLCAVPAAGAERDADEIRSVLRSSLAAYKVPRCVLFFAADELQYTGTQKVQVGPLRDAVLARLEAEGAEIEGHRYSAS
jgi:fatty-acyl-CoA synthase